MSVSQDEDKYLSVGYAKESELSLLNHPSEIIIILWLPCSQGIENPADLPRAPLQTSTREVHKHIMSICGRSSYKVHYWAVY